MKALALITPTILVAAVAPLANGATWRTAIVASDKDFSDHGSLVLEFGTTLDRVSAWRMVARVDGRWVSGLFVEPPVLRVPERVERRDRVTAHPAPVGRREDALVERDHRHISR